LYLSNDLNVNGIHLQLDTLFHEAIQELPQYCI